MLNKPQSIMFLPPFAHSHCTVHTPYETQVCNLNKAASPKVGCHVQQAQFHFGVTGKSVLLKFPKD